MRGWMILVTMFMAVSASAGPVDAPDMVSAPPVITLQPIPEITSIRPKAQVCSRSQSRATEYGSHELFNGYMGVVAGKAVGMTLTFHGSVVAGQVFVAPDFRDIEVHGVVEKQGDFTLNVGAADKSNANVFHGRFKDLIYCDSFVGSWDQQIMDIPSEGWSLQLSHSNSAGVGKNYYSDLGVQDDRQIDDNALALQKAILAKDKQAVAGMAAYPLPVMFGRKKVMIKDSGQFLRLYDQIFIPFMVSEIRAAIPHHMFEKDIGALLTSTIWLNTSGKLYSMDVLGEPIECEIARKSPQAAPAVATTVEGKKLEVLCKQFAGSMPAENPDTYETQYVCDTQKHHIVVDSKADEVPRYRAWINPHPMTGKPDMEIDRGTETIEGTGVCTVSIWTFKKGDTQFEVSPLGCTDGSEPKGATGQVLISVHDVLKQTLWCMSSGGE